MQFLNPAWLLALPIVLLPVVIHLLNQRRHRTVEWGAMQFLLAARRVNRGMARLKQIVIMAARMLIIFGLIFTISRPLSSGLAGALAGGNPESVILLLDRSASMQQQTGETGETKLSSGIAQIVNSLQTLGTDESIVLIESGGGTPIEIENATALLDMPMASATESQADLPAMLQRALDYVSDNQTGRTDIWICSDAAENDWNPESSQWKALNTGFAEREGVRFYVLNLGGRPTQNLSVVVDRFDRVAGESGPELLVDVTIAREERDAPDVTVPLEFTINGLRWSVDVELKGQSSSLIGYRIPIDKSQKVGWAHVEIPADSNASDNHYFLTFADGAALQTVVVSENRPSARAIELAARTPMKQDAKYDAIRLTPDRVSEIDWQKTALLVWQAPLPKEPVARQIANFVDGGRTVIFMPPEQPDQTEFAGLSWGQWSRTEGAGEKVGFWNNDSDLLSKTLSGQSLPVNDLLVYRHCQLAGERITLSSLNNGAPLVARAVGDAGTVYFLTTLPVATHSNLGRDGVTLFAMVHRALSTGAESVGAARQHLAGTMPAQAVSALPQLATSNAFDSPGSVDSPEPILAAARPLRAGVYGNEERLVALNRPPAEDRTVSIANEIDPLFAGLDYQLIDKTAGSSRSLVSEVWKLFVALMGIGLLVEAILCMPEKTPAKTDSLLSNVSGSYANTNGPKPKGFNTPGPNTPDTPDARNKRARVPA